jgi:hypothetical protein
LPDADPGTLARAAAEEEAVEDLRLQVRRAVRMSEAIGDQAESLSAIAEELTHAGRQLERTIQRERRWQVVGPAALGLGTIALGATSGMEGIMASALGVAASLLPYLATRGNRREHAAYLFFLAQRRHTKQRR